MSAEKCNICQAILVLTEDYTVGCPNPQCASKTQKGKSVGLGKRKPDPDNKDEKDDTEVVEKRNKSDGAMQLDQPPKTSSNFIVIAVKGTQERIRVMWETAPIAPLDQKNSNQSPQTCRRQTYVNFVRRAVQNVERGETPKALSALTGKELESLYITEAKQSIDRDEDIDLKQEPTINLSDKQLYDRGGKNGVQMSEATDETTQSQDKTKDEPIKATPSLNQSQQTQVVQVQSNVNLNKVDNQQAPQQQNKLPPQEQPPPQMSAEVKAKEQELDALEKQKEDWSSQDELREFDKGHVIALMLGGVDDSWQIVPQARSCNRGTWLNMEGQIWRMLPSGSDETPELDELTSVVDTKPVLLASVPVQTTDKSKSDKNEIQPSKMKDEAQPINGNLMVVNTHNLRSITVEVFIYYHALGDPRIPVWFYVQVYQGSKQNKKIGLAHYSFANGRLEGGAMPTKEEIAEFVRAHKALGYPTDPCDQQTAKKIADGAWYPDPPYRALDWLYKNKSGIIPNQTFAADSFPPRQIAIIRKYNRWLNCGKLMSDYRPAVRKYLLGKLAQGAQLYNKILQRQKLGPEELILLDDKIDDAKYKIDSYVTEQRLAEFKEMSAEKVIEERQAVIKESNKLAKEKETASESRQMAISALTGTLTNKNLKLDELAMLKSELEAYEKVKQAGAGVQLTEYESNAVRRAQAAYNFQQDDVASEEPELYEELDETGGRNYPEVDHVVPKNRAGRNTYLNARLVSFAHNHIYRDKKLDPEIALTPNDNKAKKKYETAKVETKKRYDAEKAMSEKYIAVRLHHQAGIKAFMQQPDKHLLLKIEAFRQIYGLLLNTLSDRPPVAEQMIVEQTTSNAPVAQVQNNNNTTNTNVVSQTQPKVVVKENA